LGEVPLFAGLGKRDLRRLAATAGVKRLPAGRCIVRERFSAEAFYVLLAGTATVTQDGAEIGVLEAGDCFGELGLLDGSPRTATVTADTEVSVVRLARARFLELVDHQPTIARSMLATLAGRVRRAEAAGSAHAQPARADAIPAHLRR
jgi:CRP/FNR family cyclic AMP-dependent transcriptional regulator